MGESEAVLDLDEARRRIQAEKPLKRKELLESFAAQPGEDVDRLILSFMEDSSADVRRAVVMIMRKRGFEDAEFYGRAAEDASALVQRTARAALRSLERLRERQKTLKSQLFRRLGGPAASDRSREESQFLRSLQSSDKELRLETIGRLGESAAPWATTLLLHALRDESWTNRTTAVEALSKRTDLNNEPLLARLQEQLWYLRSTAIEVLGRRKEVSAVPMMAHLVKDSNVEVRLALAEALGKIGGQEAGRLIEFLVHDPNYTVRTTAERALRAIRRPGQEK